MTYPAFQSDVFPSEYVNYRLPLMRSVRCERTLLVFSVDWEKDHDRWRHSRDAVDYGGILQATPVLCALLDELHIPCTWFVECNSKDPRIDMAAACPAQFESITGRPADEIGLHVHWGNHARADGSPVDICDRAWVQDELSAVNESLAAAAGRSIVSFRSGGHTAIPGLPALLQNLGYLFDGSVEDRRRSRK